MNNILVFPCGSELGLDIYYSIRYSTYFKPIGLSSCGDHGKFVYEDYIEGAPYIDDDSFADYLKKIVKERHIDAVFPATDSAILRIKEIEEELGCKVISSPIETVRICTSKRLTYKKLDGVVRIPKLYDKETITTYPVFVKPDIGHSSIGARLIVNADQLDQALLENDRLIVMENLPGEEYTIDCLTDEGQLLFCRARTRGRIRNGISVNSTYVEGSEFLEFAEKVNKALEFKGSWFIQVKRDENGELCLMEIASRIGGSSHLSMGIGVNLPLLSLFSEFGYKIRVECNKISPEMDRALNSRFKCNLSYSTVYVDYDDCLVFNKKTVNHELVGFLYKCRNENKRIILMSKHDGDLMSQLREFRLYELFDEIIHIERKDEKNRYIQDRDSILIDDSFAEREKVREATGINVFGPEMVMALM